MQQRPATYARLAAAASSRLADTRRHSYGNPLIPGGTRREHYNHRDECDEQHNFHLIAPSSLLGAAAKRELQRMRVV
jgi:hypothetical protein